MLYLELLEYFFSKREKKKYDFVYRVKNVSNHLNNEEQTYNYFHHFFWNTAPERLREHRKFFRTDLRGFGEDAFHAMWYKIFEEFRPKTILEIGIYRGQTISLFSLLSKKFNIDSLIYGISPFTPAGDSVSEYLSNLDYYEDVKFNFSHFNLPLPIFYKGLSTDHDIITKFKDIKFDLIYIDGNHDYEVVRSDFENFSKFIKINGLLVFDDASLYLDYHPRLYSSSGHPGPSKVADSISKKEFLEILRVGHNRVFQKLI